MDLRNSLDSIEPIEFIVTPTEPLREGAVARVVLVGHLVIQGDLAAYIIALLP